MSSSPDINPDERDQMRHARGKFLAMATAYALGVFNDNFFRQATLLLAIAAGRPEFGGIAAALYSLPFVLFAAPAGWLADRFPKRRVVISAKTLEMLAVLCGAAGLLSGQWWLILSMVFIMGLQATIFSPALNGSIPDLYPPSYVTRANAVLKIGTTMAILAGVVAAGYVLNIKTSGPAGIGTGLWLAAAVILVASVVGLVTSLGVPRRAAAAPGTPLPWGGPVATVRHLVRLQQDRLLASVIWADGFVWFVGTLDLLFISVLGGKGGLDLGERMISNLTFAILIGIAAGGYASTRLAVGPRWQRVLVPAVLLHALFVLLLSGAALLPAAVRLWAMFPLLVLLGGAGGRLMIPCESFIQVRPAPNEKGAVIAAANFVVFCFIILAGVLQFGLARVLSPVACLAWVAAPSLPAALWLWLRLRSCADTPAAVVKHEEDGR